MTRFSHFRSRKPSLICLSSVTNTFGLQKSPRSFVDNKDVSDSLIVGLMDNPTIKEVAMPVADLSPP